ncbi:MAG: 6-hydroxymethylpterin diphosphokinase MptE-like protein [Parachlamydiaceae bacterium]
MDHSPYQKNLRLLSLKQPILANLLSFPMENSWSFCHTGKKQELNLQKDIAGQLVTIYSPQNIKVELRQWAGMHNLQAVDWLIVYGLGLGYHYETLRPWLKGNQERHVIFLEDDMGVLRRFLEQEKAKDLLQDEQVDVFYIDMTDPKDQTIDTLAKKFMYQNTLFLPIASYEKNKGQEGVKIQFLIDFKKSSFQLFIGEYLERGKPFFSNFYHNLFQFPQAYQGNLLWNKFKGVPAIICGAGPSLQKNMEILKTLKDRALIFAGGTAMNALNAFGLTPHFGLGVDPFPAQFTRLIMNSGFETPFFFRNRMNHDAVEMIHGQKLYLAGASGYPVSNWFDEKLHLKHPHIDEGCNVINMSLSIAEALGCNPIICVGLDLAYSLGQSYSPGIEMHAIHDTKEHLITKTTEEELVLQHDIYGQPIYTLWKWIHESTWFSHFARSHPHLNFMNATEGGIGFQGVPNVTLEEAAKQYLTRQYDFDAILHGELLSIPMPQEVNKEQIKKVMNELIESINRSIDILKEIYDHNPKVWEEKQPVLDNPLKQLEERLKKELAYDTLLKVFDENYIAYIQLALPGQTASSRILDQLSGRFAYLMEICVENLKFIDKVLKRQHKLDSLPSNAKEHRVTNIPSVDSHLEEFSVKQHLSNGSVLYQNIVSGLLEGPSLLYSSGGKILAKSHYEGGKKNGVSLFYYEDGQVASKQHLKEGAMDGIQEYYYPTGNLKSSISYDKGQLDGDILLYYPSKQLKRHLQFKEGKRHGKDLIYNEFGMLKIEAEYQNGKPVGSAKMWHDNGSLAKEVSFDDEGKTVKTQLWNKDGQFIPDTNKPLDYFDQVSEQTNLLTSALNQVVDQLGGAIRTIAKEQEQKAEASFNWVEGELSKLHQQMEQLEKLNNSIAKESGTLEGTQEPLWKSPSSKRLIQQYLEVMTGSMHETMRTMSSELNFLQKIVAKNEDDSSQQQ